jgi:hypothetical protein
VSAQRKHDFTNGPGLKIFPLLLSALTICILWGGHANSADKSKQKSWIDKDWTQWTSDDCSKVLSDSPWVLNDMTPIGGRSWKQTTILLRSALPIRQAFLRKLQLQKHYDKMNAQQKQQFDQQNAADRSADSIVIVIENSGSGSLENIQEQPNFDSPDPPHQAALQISDRAFVQPIQINKTPGETSAIHETMNHFEYIFPRLVDGKPPLALTGTIAIGRDQKLPMGEKTVRVNAKDYMSAGPILLIALGAPLIVDKKTGKVEQHNFQSEGLPYIFKTSDLIYKGKREY